MNELEEFDETYWDTDDCSSLIEEGDWRDIDINHEEGLLWDEK